MKSSFPKCLYKFKEPFIYTYSNGSQSHLHQFLIIYLASHLALHRTTA